MMQTPW